MVNRTKFDYKKIATVYMAVFVILMLIYCSVNAPILEGEGDDYSLPIASILNEHNLSISDADVVYYKTLFPDWAGYIDGYSLSGYTTRAGDEMAWYFPTYAFACIPFTLILRWLKLPTIFAFPYTNLAALIISVAVMGRHLKSSDKTKLFMVLLLTLNPIVFYISSVWGEVFIYSMLTIGLTCWYNKWYKRAAIFVSVAGMLNPTIMSIGIVMIIEYAYVLLKSKDKSEKLLVFIKGKIPEIIRYGCCYIIGIIPMIYNYYNTGHINLTASYPVYICGSESTFSRFISYIFDLNYGLFPYFPFILVLSAVFLMVAVIKRNIRYLEWIIAFVINVALYSIVTHINCGMLGISRYNSWGVLILIFATVLIGADSLTAVKAKIVSFFMIGMGVLLTTSIVFSYGPTHASNTSCVYFTPIAEWTLDHFSKMYNPLKSTFNARTIHVDGGYSYETPVAYSAEDGYVRKILASEKDKAVLLDDYVSLSGINDNYINQVNDLKGVGYISLSAKDEIVRIKSYETGQSLFFTTNDSKGLEYAVQGLSSAEDWGTWSVGNKTIFRMKTNAQSEWLHCEIAASVYNNIQNVTIAVNGQNVYQNPEYTGEGIQFDFHNPGIGNAVNIVIDMPDAKSPAELGESVDERVLGLGFTQMVITEAAMAN